VPNFTENLPELFERINKAETEDEKVTLLRGYKQQTTLHTILQSAYGNLTWALPVGRPPFRESELPYGFGGLLDREIRKFVYFFNEHPRKITKTTQRESVFIQLLENLHPSESEIVLQAKEGDIIGVSHDIVYKAFPVLVPPAPAIAAVEESSIIQEPVDEVKTQVKKKAPKKRTPKKRTPKKKKAN